MKNVLSILKPKRKPNIFKEVSKLQNVVEIEYVEDGGSRPLLTFGIPGVASGSIGGGELPKRHIKVTYKK